MQANAGVLVNNENKNETIPLAHIVIAVIFFNMYNLRCIFMYRT